jgi:NAD(P)-dependent dehydrogenase (short-subunit alcohol dehydrogenase family)
MRVVQNLSEKVVVITGAGSGIGRGSAWSFARVGGRVVIGDVDGDRAAAVAAELTDAGFDAAGAACDVAADGGLESLRDLALARFGRVDVVMNNVGVIAAGQPLNIPMSEWQRIIDVNLLSVVHSNQVFLPLLLEQGQGHVVNTASTAALYPYSYDRLPYTATKAAIVAVSEALALYLRPRGVGITCLCPGPVSTNIVEQMAFHGEMGELGVPELPLLDPADVGDMVVQAVREGRFLLLTHPDAVHEILVCHAQDPEEFLAAQVVKVSGEAAD